MRIEDYAMIGDLGTAALVSKDGSIDWLCMPRFDSDACMAALLGRDDHGCWLLHPGATVRKTTRRYRPGTVILETDFECDGGVVRFVDFMPIGPERRSLVRIVEGLKGSVPINMSLLVRFGYGRSRPWIVSEADRTTLTTAPDSLDLFSTVPVEHDDKNVFSVFTVKEGQAVAFELNWRPSYA